MPRCGPCATERRSRSSCTRVQPTLSRPPALRSDRPARFPTAVGRFSGGERTRIRRWARCACKQAACERHLPGAPYVSLLERPGVDRVAVADQAEQARLGELLAGPLVEALQPRSDHRVVEHPAQALIVGDIAVDVAVEREAVRQYTPQ